MVTSRALTVAAVGLPIPRRSSSVDDAEPVALRVFHDDVVSAGRTLVPLDATSAEGFEAGNLRTLVVCVEVEVDAGRKYTLGTNDIERHVRSGSRPRPQKSKAVVVRLAGRIVERGSPERDLPVEIVDTEHDRADSEHRAMLSAARPLAILRACHAGGVPDRVDVRDEAFLSAAAKAIELIRSPEVRDQWQGASALPKMSVGALACHLGRQVVRAAELLPVTSDVPPLDSADAHYHRAAWATSSSPDDPPNDRSQDDAEAVLGVSALEDRASRAFEAVRALFDAGDACDVVLIPWQGWSLRRDDFLLTRLVEIVVHADDLAVSVGVSTPEFPNEAFGPVRDLLVRLATARHGQAAVISALSRRERSRNISAF
jgi:hypothetical protein